ncbi:hypothetical protein GYMLUDRAFT_40475 [Collybiopsis luxurians FD-317 M1]|uniref:Unplaced genomic scaffold GYMLUscaffold_14, whole genome shotgun sequence n=1 Tax=Collybiopsis luxurians FD-317 M1 TaxID=944289 RepID=A0A0D0BJ43_9AGAR|nr:hypothetical protein GYMLUDRAFT_40475 [Collybiopsis luxurians FD-317 M1]
MTAVGLYRPEDWPEFMGHWSDAYTIRRFWGRVWHQQLRHLVSAPGDLVAQRWLCLARGTNASAYTKLFIAFLITGTIHQVGDYSLQHRDFWAGGSLYFFVSQAVAITVEDGIIALGKKGGIQDSGYVRILGYVWTVSWFAFSLPVWLDPCVHDGVLKGMSMSIIGGLWKGDWTGETVKFSLPLGY